jgi:hypothetical protein
MAFGTSPIIADLVGHPASLDLKTEGGRDTSSRTGTVVRYSPTPITAATRVHMKCGAVLQWHLGESVGDAGCVPLMTEVDPQPCPPDCDPRRAGALVPNSAADSFVTRVLTASG